MDDLLTCRVCYEQYKEGVRAPVLLPRCGHTFCRPCVSYLQSGCSVTCRVCSTEQRVDSVEALPTEFSLLAIIAARDCQKAETCKIHEVKLSFWCRTCGEATCGECLFEDHPTHSHDVVRAQKYIQEMRIIARDIADKFMDALDTREQRFYNRVFKGARAISNALRSVNVLRKDMDEARTLMKGAREVESIVPANELADAAKYLGLKWSIQDVNLYASKEKQEENKNKKEIEEKVTEEVQEENIDNENKSEVKENEDETKHKEDIAEKENETKENGDPEDKDEKLENDLENKECVDKNKEEKKKAKKMTQRRYSDSEDSEEETSRLKKNREEKEAKEAARMKRVADKEAEEKLRENIMKQLKEERQRKEEEKRKKEEEEKKAVLQERQLGRQARLPKLVEEPQSNSSVPAEWLTKSKPKISPKVVEEPQSNGSVPAEWLKKSKPKISRLKRAKTMGLVGEQDEQPQGEPGKLVTSASTANVPAIKTTDDIPTDEQKKENQASVKKKKQEKNEVKSEEKEKENESTKEINSNDIKDKNNDNNDTLNNGDQNKEVGANVESENTDTKEKRNKEREDDEDKDLDESAENPMTEYEPDDKPGGNKIKIDICQFPAFQIVVEGYGGRLARMEWEDKGLHVYCHQFQELPYDVIIKSAVLYSLIPTKSPLVFMDINGGKHSLGRVYIRLWGHLRRAQNFLTLCLGDLGTCYMCTRMLETYNDEVPGERIKGGDYEFNNGHGGKGVIQDLEHSTEYSMPMESGMISSGGAHGEPTESQFMICTESNPDSNFVCPFGTVVAGLQIVKQAVHRMTVQDVWIRDCGIVIETSNFQA